MDKTTLKRDKSAPSDNAARPLCACRKGLPGRLGLNAIVRIDRHAETAVEQRPGVVAQVDHGIDRGTQAGLGPACIHRGIAVVVATGINTVDKAVSNQNLRDGLITLQKIFCNGLYALQRVPLAPSFTHRCRLQRCYIVERPHSGSSSATPPACCLTIRYGSTAQPTPRQWRCTLSNTGSNWMPSGVKRHVGICHTCACA